MHMNSTTGYEYIGRVLSRSYILGGKQLEPLKWGSGCAAHTFNVSTRCSREENEAGHSVLGTEVRAAHFPGTILCPWIYTSQLRSCFTMIEWVTTWGWWDDGG